jgi:carbonic anhydrase/acetyltransferase-like protein (isoleucine patch superfamily)
MSGNLSSDLTGLENAASNDRLKRSLKISFIPMSKPKPANILKTLARLWPALFFLPFRMLLRGTAGLYFQHPLATIEGCLDAGKFCEISKNTYINAGSKGVKIGIYTQVNQFTSIVGNVVIGDRVLVAPSCTIAAGGHKFGKGIQPRFSGGGREQHIFIGDDVWIGAGVTIVGDVSIGSGSVIAAGLVIDSNVPANTLVRRGTILSVHELIS